MCRRRFVDCILLFPVPSQVEDLTVYKRSRHLLGLQWAKPNVTYGDLASFTIKYGVGEPTENISVEPKHCVVWPELYCYTLQDLTADQLYTITVSIIIWILYIAAVKKFIFICKSSEWPWCDSSVVTLLGFDSRWKQIKVIFI